MTKVKICGLRRTRDAQLMNSYKPDYAGLVFAPSPRQINLQEAYAIKSLLNTDIQTVGVFVNADLPELLTIAQSGVLDLIQLHGDEDEAYVRALQAKTKLPLIRACRVKNREQVMLADRSTSQYLLLDAYSEQYGGSGQGFDYGLVPRLQHEYFLAGGLRADNVAAAIRRLQPFAVDASSALETEGNKDEEKLAAFIAAIRNIKEDEADV